MRIVAGAWKGRALVAPSGHHTRPTSDRARESLFNRLAHAPWSPGLAKRRVLDLFAGSGALGLEALSRGAAFALFVETDEAARGAIRRNIEALQAFGNTRLHRRSAVDLGPRPAGLGAPFDLVFLDPPYGQGLIPQAVAALPAAGWIAQDALIVAETGADEPLTLPGFSPLDERRTGAARISIWRYGAGDEAALG
jgi:16S rRNA (guanine966-N2)-methyltransferase